ncbi:MAG: hypothetical protein K9H64_20235 [Bacteroidales bacterium]|nr:hypothetical protein [Bacteroidales bacterium]MCF8458381.1 hypothetical protein [Bacteroidales bacterium]
MKEEMNYIDELFDKELGVYEMGTASQGWAAVSEGLAKKGLLAFFRTSLLLKLATAVSTAGLISFLTIISLNPDFFAEDTRPHNENVICEPGMFDSFSQPTDYSKQSTVGSPQMAVTSSQPSIRNPQSPISPEPTFSNHQSGVNSSQLVATVVQPETRNSKPETPSFAKAMDGRRTQNPKPETQNPKSGTQNPKPETRNQPSVLSQQPAVGSSQSSNDGTDLADNILSEKDIEAESKNSTETKINQQNFEDTKNGVENELNPQSTIDAEQPESGSQQPEHGSEQLANNNPQPATRPQSLVLSQQLADDAVQPEIRNPQPATSPQSSVLSPQLADDAVQPTTSPQSAVHSQQLADDAVQPETRNLKPETNTFSNINNEALPIYYTMPQRGFVPTTQQEDQTIALKQEYLSPPVNNRGYNPLSWAVSAYLAPQQPSVLLQSEDLEGEALLTYIESGLQQPSVFNGGIRMEVRGRNFLLESGISFLQISQKGKYQTLDIFNRDTTLWDFWDSSFTKIDTLDSYFQVFGNDTTWFYITQTNEITDTGSTSYDSTITTREDLTHTFTNRYKYLEIPLIMGYSFTKSRLTTSVKAGVISSFLWQSHGQSISGLSKNDIYSFTHDDFPAIRLDLYSALELRYFFGPRYFVFGEAYYRQSFSPFIVRENISYRFNSYGLKLGAGVYF